MTHQDVAAKLAERPELCQVWESALALEGDGGVLYLSNISRAAESVGMVHIYIWDKTAKGKPAMTRKAALELMQREGLDRLIGEVDLSNLLALRYARNVGFNEVGVVRQRRGDDGKVRNVVLLDALPGDLRWA